MNYYGGKEMAASFRTVRKNTIQIATDIPEDKYGYRATPDTRTIAETLVHIAVVFDFPVYLYANKISEMAKVDFPALFGKMASEESKPRTKAEIIALLESKGEEFASLLEGLPDSYLAENLVLPPGATPATRSRFDMLLSAKEHEMHHRAQLMVLERLVGVVPHLTRQREAQQAARAQTAQQQKA
jgi:uncharacterized damage-inducible protein DinB